MNSVFTIPADFNIETIQRIVSENKKLFTQIAEVYGSNSNSDFGSGRKQSILPKTNLEQLKDYIKFCNENKIKFNYTFNFTCINNLEFTLEGKNKIINEIAKLTDLGITDFTVANPAIIDILEESFPQINVTVSIITGVDSIEKLEYFCKYKNVKYIYIHEKMYRNIDLLKTMVKVAHNYKKKVGIIINSTCLADCPFRNFHYDFCSNSRNRDNYIISEYYCTKCKIEKLKDKRKVLTMPWIRPEDFTMYQNLGIDKFKVSGREISNKSFNAMQMVKIYNENKYDGNLMDLFKGFKKCYYTDMYYIKNDENLQNYLLGVFKNKIECNRYKCEQCQKCKDALDSIVVNEIKKNTTLQSYDEIIKQYSK